MTLVHVQLHPQAATMLKTDRGVFGYRMDATISSKAASEKAKTMVSHNRYIYQRIDFFRTVILSLPVSTGNNGLVSFLVHQVPQTSATVWQYCQVFIQFSLRI